MNTTNTHPAKATNMEYSWVSTSTVGSYYKKIIFFSTSSFRSMTNLDGVRKCERKSKKQKCFECIIDALEFHLLLKWTKCL